VVTRQLQIERRTESYLVESGQSHDEAGDQQIGHGQGYDEQVGWRAQAAYDGDRGTDERVAEHCADDDEDEHTQHQRRPPRRTATAFQSRRRRHGHRDVIAGPVRCHDDGRLGDYDASDYNTPNNRRLTLSIEPQS